MILMDPEIQSKSEIWSQYGEGFPCMLAVFLSTYTTQGGVSFEGPKSSKSLEGYATLPGWIRTSRVQESLRVLDTISGCLLERSIEKSQIL